MALLGALVSAFLTWVKFGSDYRCDVDFLSGCARFGDCSKVLTSGPSTFLDVPITALATAFYLIAGAIQLSVALDRRWFYGVEREIGGLSGWFTVCTSIIMAAYAGLVLQAFCLYCSSLYLTSVAFCATAQGSTGIRVSEFFMHLGRARWLASGRSIKAVTIAVSATTTIWVGEAALYDAGRSSIGSSDACTVDISRIPPAALVSDGGDRAELVFHEVIDLACGHCRSQWQELHQIASESGGRVRVEYHLFPREPGAQFRCAPKGFEPDAASLQNQSCYAALALACAAKIAPERANHFLKLLFGLQGQGVPYFQPHRVHSASREAGLPVSKEDPAAGPMGVCIESNEEVFELMYRTVRFAMEQQISSTPRLYAVRCSHGECDLAHAVQIQGAKHEEFLKSLTRKLLAGLAAGSEEAGP